MAVSMSFTPSLPPTAVVWSSNTASTSHNWDTDATPEIFDLLVDIDGNYIVDNTGTTINLFGGYIPDAAATVTTYGSSGGTGVSWTPEG